MELLNKILDASERIKPFVRKTYLNHSQFFSELIGGDVSVTNVDPAIVSGTVEAVKKISKVGVLCGAGIKNGKDVIKAIELGSRGVLLASGVTKSDNPEATLMDLISLID